MSSSDSDDDIAEIWQKIGNDLNDDISSNIDEDSTHQHHNNDNDDDNNEDIAAFWQRIGNDDIDDSTHYSKNDTADISMEEVESMEVEEDDTAGQNNHRSALIGEMICSLYTVCLCSLYIQNNFYVLHTICIEVLFYIDTLSKIISYLPPVDLVKLTLVCKRFSNASNKAKLTLIENSARIAVHDIATEEQLAALDGKNSLADYYYLQLLREPLMFDQLVGRAEYVNINDKSCVSVTDSGGYWGTAFSNNVLRAGKHYVTFTPRRQSANGVIRLVAGVMRQGQANQKASHIPTYPEFYLNFSGSPPREKRPPCKKQPKLRGRGRRASPHHRIMKSHYSAPLRRLGAVQCCMYSTDLGAWHLSDWMGGNKTTIETAAGISSGDEVGMLLDLDEGTLSAYKNGRKLGGRSGLAGQFCWTISIPEGVQVTIKRGTIPVS